MDQNGLIKSRTLNFSKFHPDPHQAGTAVPLLQNVLGVHSVEPVSPRAVRIVYNVAEVSFRMLEEALVDIGFTLDNGLMVKLRRAMYYYTDDNQRSILDCPRGDSNCIQGVFVNRYLQLRHGCRDARPEHWRKYL
jgi:hypothetical protein